MTDQDTGGDVAREVMAAPGPPEVDKDRRHHGGVPAHPDDDALAGRTERERVDLGLDAYDPDDVPPATDVADGAEVTETDVYREARAEVRRQVEAGELPTAGRQADFPPGHYDRT